MNLAPPIRWVQPSREPTAAPEARPGEWSELPAIERATGELELTARSQVFVGGLVSRRPARATLAPLRGGRSLEGPHGLVRGIARALDGGRRDGPELAPAPPVRARRRSAALAEPAASAPSLATEQEMDAEPAPAPTDVGLGAADLPEPRARVVQAVTRFGGPRAGEAPALIRAAEGAPNPPAGRISRAPLALDRAEAHVTEADTSAAVASAPHDTSSAEPSPAPPLSEFLPRRLRGRSAPQPALGEPEAEPGPGPGPSPEPAATTESDVEARTVDGEPPRDEPRAIARHERRDGGAIVRSASGEVRGRGFERADRRRRTAGTGRHLGARSVRSGSEARHSDACTGDQRVGNPRLRCGTGSETEVPAAPVEAAAVTSRSGDAAVAASPEEHVSFEPSPEGPIRRRLRNRVRPSLPPAAAKRRRRRRTKSRERRRCSGGRRRRANAVPSRCPRRCAGCALRRRMWSDTRHRRPRRRTSPLRPRRSQPRARYRPRQPWTHAWLLPVRRHARTAARTRFGTGDTPVPPGTSSRNGSRPARSDDATRVEAATPHERVAPAARGDTREPVARPRVAESPLPAPEIRAHARPSTAAGVQRRKRRSCPNTTRHERTPSLPRRPAPNGERRRSRANPLLLRPAATRASPSPARAVESPPRALEAKPHAEPATAAKVRRQATAQPRERSAPETTAEPPEAVTRTRAVESPPAPEPQPHAQATTAAQIRRQATAQPRELAAPATAAEPPEAVTRARAVESPPPAQSTRPPAQASPGADVDRQATEQRHEHAAPEASTEAREPAVPSTVADAPVPTSEARTHSDADSTSEASKPWRAHRRIQPQPERTSGAGRKRRPFSRIVKTPSTCPPIHASPPSRYAAAMRLRPS